MCRKPVRNHSEGIAFHFSMKSNLRSSEACMSGQIQRNSIFLWKCAVILETIIDRRLRKKDSIAIKLFFRQHAIKFEPLSTVQALGVQKKRPNSCFGQKSFLANNVWAKKAKGLMRAPSCSSRQRASKHTTGGPKRSGQYLTSGQGSVRSHADPRRSCCISVDVS